MQRQRKRTQDKSKVFAKRLLRWFKYNNRDLPWRKESSSYKILIAEKLLQQTAASHVLSVYGKFFERYPTVQALADTEQEEIEEIIRPLGLWRTRSGDLKRMAKQLCDEYYGEIPCDKQNLLELFGIGEYAASAVCCFGFGREEAVVDVNVRRVFKRLVFWESELPKDVELKEIMCSVMRGNKLKDFNWALFDFASAICNSRAPRCNKCFANEICRYFYDVNRA